MIKIEAIFRDARNKNQIAFLTNEFVIPGIYCKCLFAFYEEKENKWFLSWTKSNVHQLMKNEQAKASLRIKFNELPEELKILIQQEVDKANQVEEKSIEQLKKGF
jgi:hypothetical protein